MTEQLWPWCLGIGWLLSFAAESLVHPRPKLPGRPLWTYLLHSGLWLLIFTVFLLIVQRPIFAMLAGLGIWLAVVLVGNAKEASLREPFVFMDFEYFTDAIKHPRLYLPFLGLWRAIALGIIAVAVIGAALRAETPLTAHMPWLVFLKYGALSLFVAACLLWVGDRWSDAPSLQPEKDIRDMGFAPSLWLYGRAERAPVQVPAARPFGPRSEPPHIPVPNPNIPELPSHTESPGHLVIVQSESFFDVRRLWPHIAPEVFRDFDAAHRQCVQSGQIRVPPWGANTIRTEFSLLTGWSPAALGIHQFQPYRFLARRPLPSIAWRLRAQGYRTICIHPYPSSFYARNTIYPLLGFDDFLDVAEFTPEDRSGPYTGDRAVADKTLQILQGATQPTFIFIITMENHGPLHLESVSAAEKKTLLLQEPPVSADDLAIYLRHVRNAGAMLQQFMSELPRLSLPSVLGFYGDHVPIMEKFYEARHFADGRTDYWLWSSRHPAPGSPQHPEIAVAELGVRALDLLSTTRIN
ncbi:LTA synthase family protein [Acidithiobacillus thiooxidans]|uniref:Capsular polysaccharide biosynthesis protein RkpI n=1 Tax=Acidithiobacillus thiooxidans ATCC 19377 TaxID=637390 RepID=A0A543Q3B1_ACITH|nr:LTA synthase family protein [Acidithiobacillus thiooxidans]MDX5935051.1 LTA synthase family protein [Acidithiobacillus thiooxidans]TQN50823.1 Capsular polysaccharide biosynthesis protein RkpI [Acidithiobacillus thiooxidans ATCC 19377]